MTLDEGTSALKVASKPVCYALSDDVVKISRILSGWDAIHLIRRATAGDIVVPAAKFPSEENYLKQPKACREAVKWLTLITEWALQEGLSSDLTKEIVEEHLEEFKYYISVDSSTWDNFVHVFFTRHKIDGATQFIRWYRHQRAIGRKTWFSFQELEKATSKFDRALKCGEGKTGLVYKGIEQFSGQFIAVKRLRNVTNFSLNKLLHEIAVHEYIKSKTKSELNLVNLVGFCPFPVDPLLVYEFMRHGNLREHLQGHHGNYLRSHALVRLCVALDVAKALKQLHYHCEPPVYHRDVKSTNILLDNCYRAKLADLSTAEILGSNLIDSSDDGETVGTLGYVDPVYEKTRQSNDLTDVYSFGVVLMELATYLRAWDAERPVKLLTDIVKEKIRAGNVNEILTLTGSKKPGIRDRESITTMKLLLLLAVECCSLDLTTRPRIDEVEESLRQIHDQLEDQEAELEIDAAMMAVGQRDNNKNKVARRLA